MKRIKPKSITDLLHLCLREEGLETPLLEHRLIHHGWGEVAGELVASHTNKLTIYNQTLYMECSSAAVRQEIVLQRSELVRKLNLFVNAYIIKDIVVR